MTDGRSTDDTSHRAAAVRDTSRDAGTRRQLSPDDRAATGPQPEHPFVETLRLRTPVATPSPPAG